jgi:hypothetical protein
VLDQHLDVRDVAAPLDQRLEVGRTVQVALAVGRVLEELAEPREVTLGRVDVGAGLDRVEPRGLGRDPAVVGRARDEDVVAGPVGHDAEDRLDRATAGLDVDALVTDGVAVERRGVGAGDDVADPHVVVAQDQPAPLDGTGARREVVELEVTRLERVVGRARLVGEVPDRAVGDRAGHSAVVEQGRVGREALLAHQLLAEQVAVLVTKLGVALARQPTECSVVGHHVPFHCPIIGHTCPLSGG